MGEDKLTVRIIEGLEVGRGTHSNILPRLTTSGLKVRLRETHLFRVGKIVKMKSLLLSKVHLSEQVRLENVGIVGGEGEGVIAGVDGALQI